MCILIVAEHDGKTLSEQTARALSAALKIGGEVDILVAGEGVDAVAQQAARLAGIRKVLCADSPALAHQLAEPVSALLFSMADRYDTLMAPATTSGKNIMPRLAALCDVMQVSEVMNVVSPRVFKRPIYAGNAIQTVEASDGKLVLTIRTASFAAAPAGGSAPVEAVTVAAASGPTSFVENIGVISDRPELTSARIVVSGGRALGSREKFEKLILPLADRLSAAVGASRAAVDAGYAPNDWQVGQTGKIVAPDLYIAIGISGAIQHVAGMQDAKVIVAINKDADAPIFQIADYGLVGDLFEIVPALEQALS
jgi:electron transfer flavoprotein alpha subunit